MYYIYIYLPLGQLSISSYGALISLSLHEVEHDAQSGTQFCFQEPERTWNKQYRVNWIAFIPRDSVWLQALYKLGFISLQRRRVSRLSHLIHERKNRKSEKRIIHPSPVYPLSHINFSSLKSASILFSRLFQGLFINSFTSEKFSHLLYTLFSQF